MNLSEVCNWYRAVVLSWVVLLTGVLATPSEAQRRDDPLAGLTSSQRRVFQNYTRLHCKQFFRFDDDRFVLLPNYERARENSTGKTPSQVEDEMTVVKRERRQTPVGFNLVDVKYPPPNAEVIIAAKVIPAIDVGHYGFVNSFVIKEIVGPAEMIVGGIQFIPESEVGDEENTHRKAALHRQQSYADKTYRLLGFSTKGLEAGDAYMGPQKKGLQVAVVSTDPQYDFVLVNYDKLERVRTRDFVDVLDYVQIEPLAYIELVRSNREKLGTDGDKASLIWIYRRFYNRYRPKRLSSISRPETEITQQDAPSQAQPKIVFDSEVNEPNPEKDAGHESDPRDRKPDPQPDRQPDPQPRAASDPEQKDQDEQEDDWDHEADTENSPDQPTFFGIPL